MTKALLILTGGRSVPDMLVAKYLQPDIILIITTKQGLGTAAQIEHWVQSALGCKIEMLPVIDPDEEEDIKRACINALEQYPEVEWTMHITSAPKLVSLSAVSIASERSIPCLYLNTDRKKVSVLGKKVPIDANKLFQTTVKEYMRLHQREYKTKSAAYRQKAQLWYNVAQILVQHPKSTRHLLSQLRRDQENKGRDEPVSFRVDIQAQPLIEQLASPSIDMLVIDRAHSDRLECTITDGDKREFLNGDWLEVYVWAEVGEEGFAQDREWGYKLIHRQDEYELDVALTTGGLLFIVECKTDYNPFTKKSYYLDTIDANAGLLGRSYVSKFFVTNHPDPQSIPSYESFRQQAEQKKIRIIAADELPRIGAILRDEVDNPTYPRI